MGNKNLSVHSLTECIEDKPLKKGIMIDLENLRIQTKYCKSWRNKWHSHRDLDIALNPSINKLNPETFGPDSNTFKLLSGIINKVQKHYLGSTTNYKKIQGPEDAYKLLVTLGLDNINK